MSEHAHSPLQRFRTALEAIQQLDFELRCSGHSLPMEVGRIVEEALSVDSGSEICDLADPMEAPLPCDVVVGDSEFRDGAPLGSLVSHARFLHALVEDLGTRFNANVQGVSPNDLQALPCGPGFASREADLTKALRFYADPNNWEEQESGIGLFPSEAEKDGGERACNALRTGAKR